MSLGNVISVISAKGGSGSTTVTANFACGLAKLGKKVLAIDCNFGFRSLDDALGLQERVVFDCTDVLSGRREADEVCLEHPRYPGLYLIPAPQRLALHEDEDEQTISVQEALASFVTQVSEAYDYVLLDLPTANLDWLLPMSTISKEVLIISTQERVSLRNVDQLYHLLKKQGCVRCRFLLNHYVDAVNCRGIYPEVDQISDYLSCELLGMLIEEDEVRDCMEQGKPIIGKACESGQVLRYLVKEFLKK
ncbi:MAG: AAA family ATPase [Lachnospiraceae bacterium]|nr:AAA family ATPase [Lachnospiraceae bacterium]